MHQLPWQAETNVFVTLVGSPTACQECVLRRRGDILTFAIYHRKTSTQARTRGGGGGVTGVQTPPFESFFVVARFFVREVGHVQLIPLLNL